MEENVIRDLHDEMLAAVENPTFERQLVMLDHMDEVFSRLNKQFPDSEKFAGQLGAIQYSKKSIREMASQGGALKQEKFEGEMEKIRSAFVKAGAKRADLKEWGLG